LTKDDVRAVYDDLVALHNEGELASPMGAWTTGTDEKVGALLYSLHPQFGVDHFGTVELKAARVLVGLGLDHPLVDGNKRLAIFSMHEQLIINGFEADVTDDDLIDACHRVIEASRQNVPAANITGVIASWLATKLVAR
jgi:prophage maintenance system killer protein